jgi:hypothetical protein
MSWSSEPSPQLSLFVESRDPCLGHLGPSGARERCRGWRKFPVRNYPMATVPQDTFTEGSVAMNSLAQPRITNQ